MRKGENGRRQRVELGLEHVLCFFHQLVHLVELERRRFKHVIRRAILMHQPELLRLLPEGRAG
jgi:hypothetical protein